MPAAERASGSAAERALEAAARALLPHGVVRMLDADGVLRPHKSYTHADLDADDLRALYRFMVTARRIDEQAVRLQRQGELGVYASLLGQEAAQVGAAYALRAGDWVFPTYRDHAVALVRGVDPAQLMHQWRGTWLSGHDALQERMGYLTIPIGTQAVHATGLAMAARHAGDDVVVLACFGDGATSEGDVHEALNFAAVFAAPVVFLAQHNGYAISTAASQQTKAPSLAHKAVGYGLPGVRVDGNDVLAVHAVVAEAVDRARRGDGPTLVEALTYRMESHTTADDPSRYRDAAEVESWRQRDPILRYRKWLLGGGLLDADLVAQIDADAEHLAAALRDEVSGMTVGSPTELFDHVYVEATPELAAQRALLQAELARAAPARVAPGQHTPDHPAKEG